MHLHLNGLNGAPTFERIVAEVPRCPACGHHSFTVTPQLCGRKILLAAVACAACAADILDTFRALTARGR